MTMRFRVEKLIRDRLPEIMRGQGLAVFDRRLDDAEFVVALGEKLVEEAHEARLASPSEIAGELADVLEVVHALAQVHGLSLQDVEAARQAKRAERGGFDARVYNAAVEAADGLPAAAYYLARPTQYPRED
ncbi:MULTISPECIES: nucleoside triphosphate pyrophosphohydrolase [unclassified Phenylobacterium]|uniref:nucleoside triphosphate pyrophosphohydrolase n=1 Tax=unclassified Phenylobacterium TaxID=2640670 RepID=UPI0022B31400|nr:nucleoside triphosphate pyrophosphohydrolase [Phenylobacterium sp. NIBR 498073]WGU38646.1 nucleoside triphosphate pyrophosphohydrolase [Phenylobacterium sp. NIBR 498073]